MKYLNSFNFDGLRLNYYNYFFQDALTILQQTEIRLSQLKSLKFKLADCQEAGAFAARLMAEPDGVPLLGGSHSAVGSVLHKALENSVRHFLFYLFIRIRFLKKEEIY